MPTTSPAPERATAAEPTAATPGRRTAVSRVLRWTFGVLLGLLALAVGAWWLVLSQIVPKIDQWREPLAQQASKTLGVTVQMGRVEGRVEGWRPVLSLDDVTFLDAQGQPALKLPRITARLSLATLWPTSIWRKEVHVDRLVVVRPQLSVRRDRDGRIQIAGLSWGASDRRNEGDNPGLTWLLSQELIVIEQGAITWTDELRAAPPLSLTAVDFSLRNHPGLGQRLHDISLQGTPPASFGQRFELTARLSQPLWLGRGTRADAPWFGEASQVGDWRTWSGELNAHLPHVDVQSLKQHASLPFDVQGGRGRLALTFTLQRGQPQALQLDADLQAVALTLGEGLAPLGFAQIRGTVTAQHEARQTSLAWSGLSFVTTEGLRWPASAARLQWQHPPAMTAPGQAGPVLLPELQGDVLRRTTEGRLDIDRVDLALLAQLADRLPLAAGLRAQLAQLAPVGTAEGLQLSWQGPASAPVRYTAQGRVNGLTLQAGAERPGLSGASMQFKADERGGQADLTIRQGWAEFPGAFEEPRIPVDTLDARLTWTVTAARTPGAAPTVEVQVNPARFANADAEGEVKATWRTGAGSGVGEGGRYPGHLVMTGKLSRAQGNRVWRYLPAVMLPEARYYVRDAVRSGLSSNTTFEVDGDLWHFPFKDDQGGRFRVNVAVEDAVLDYVPAARAPAPGSVAAAPYWPSFTKLNGQLIFEGQGMRVENATAVLGGLGSGTYTLRNISGRIPDLDHDDPVLAIQGEGTGPLQDLLRYVQVSPVGPWTGRMLDDARGQGQAALNLALTLPLNRLADARIEGKVSLKDSDQAALRLSPSAPLLQSVRGQIQFTQDSIQVQARARVWGQDVVVQGSRDAQGVPRFVATGTLSAEGLRSATEWPAVARLAQGMSGQTPVTVTVALARGKASAAGHFVARPELQVQSTLQGLALDLPAPLRKDAAAAWPLRIVHRADDAEGTADLLQVDLSGPVQLRADYRREQRDATWQVARGAVSLTEGGSPPAPLPMPPTGVVGRVNLPVIDVDAWQQVLDTARVPPQAAAAPASGAVTPAPANGAVAAAGANADDYLPNTLSLKAGALTWRQRTLKDVAVTLAHPSPDVWRAQIESRQLAGQVEIKPDTSGSGPAPTQRVVARLSRLLVPEADADAFEDHAAQQMLSADTTTSVPALDIVIDQFEWRGLPLGKLEVEAVNRLNASPGAAPLPEWRLVKFRLVNNDAQLNATGNWAALGAQQVPPAAPGARKMRPRHRAAFSFSLDLANSGALLNRLGLPQTLKGGKGKLGGQVSWLGSPLEPDAPSMNGTVNVAISEGQFLKADPGVAKLLGVLSLQSLPRRLVLDFRDVFQQGFAFDRIEGEVNITQGVAATRNLRMRGVQAVVLMEGQADLARESQNLRVFVVPEINAGTASLAYAAINPAVGLGTFIAQVLLRKTVVEASTREFTITGSWSDPQVEQVRRSTVPAAADDAASAPSQTAPAPATVTGTRTPS